MTNPLDAHVMRLIGDAYVGDEEGFVPFLMRAFPCFQSAAAPGSLAHFLIYESVTDPGPTFAGVQVDAAAEIPDGMTAFDLRRDGWSISGATDWEGVLSWRWLEEGRSIGGFDAQVPPAWAIDGAQAVSFRLRASAYFVPGEKTDDSVQIADYDPSWPALYEKTAADLMEALGPEIARRIEHYGSTSIPGMPAKPIIDVLVEIPSFDDALARILPYFDRPECEFWRYSDHLIFIVRDGVGGRRTHHIHMAPAGHSLWDGIPFRNHLRAHPADADAYASLKRSLAERYRDDREAYTEAKTDFVRGILSKQAG